MDNVQLVNPEMCKPLFGKMEANGRETANRNSSGSPWGVRHTVLCLKQFFFKLRTVFSTQPNTLQVLLLLILTRRKHPYFRGAHR